MKKIFFTSFFILTFSLNALALESIVDSKEIRKLSYQLAKTFHSRVALFKVNSSKPLEMVKQYSVLAHGFEEAQTFEFWENHETLELDEPSLAGTLKTSVVVKEVSYEAPWVAKNSNDKEEVRKLENKIVDLTGLLILSGAEFGFDGNAKNSCGLPTPYLLVLDPQAQKVYGMTLHPCTK